MTKIFASIFIVVAGSLATAAQTAFIRINQAGYLPSDKKIAIAFADTSITGQFLIRTAETKAVVFAGNVHAVTKPD